MRSTISCLLVLIFGVSSCTIKNPTDEFTISNADENIGYKDQFLDTDTITEVVYIHFEDSTEFYFDGMVTKFYIFYSS
ncbi:MAG: hypothetical protein HRT57_06825 [Crocinitomicaceae bacterium]|nr:hypothetical protein [Crocinitomicaceae bacterium]